MTTICGKCMLRILEMEYEDRDLFYLELQTNGVAGLFLNDACLYIVSGKNIYRRMIRTCHRINIQDTSESRSLLLLKPYLEQLEWRVLETNIDDKDKWLQYYNPPLNTYNKDALCKFAGTSEDIDDFMHGLTTVADLQALNKPIIGDVGHIQGVYMIRNSLNNKVYIGSSTDIHSRWVKHKNMLARGKHTSYKLQAAYNYSHNIDDFEFVVIEEVSDKKQLLNREQYWMDYYNACNSGYNCTMFANCMDKYLTVCK